ncbi:MAG: hypothetical protein QOE58_161 [Actinomycetota bacterium]|nr:hypothetical protein [Actinomycetota bacterium]
MQLPDLTLELGHPTGLVGGRAPGAGRRLPSAWRTQFRSDSLPMPSWWATRVTTAKLSSVWSTVSSTIRTARSRSSVGYFGAGRFVLVVSVIDSILPSDEASTRTRVVHGRTWIEARFLSGQPGPP